jgi:tetraacyldisaccharide 4'-kinase
MYKVPSGLAPIFFIPGLAFEALVRLRNGAYSSNRLPRRKLDSPVISIGNITMGGTGKTPLAIHIAQMLLKMECTPAILSRGYGRLSSRMQVIPPGLEMKNSASMLGDEPALIRRRVPGAWMGISKNRFAAGRLIERQKNGVAFILDDGFQHRKLCRDLDIVTIDRSQPLESNRIFPRGTLREPISALRRCHIIAINSVQNGGGSFESVMKKLGIQAKFLKCEQQISEIIPFADWQKSCGDAITGLNVKKAYAVAALGNPSRFLNDLERNGIEIRGKSLYPDHRELSRNDWIFCCERAREKAAEAIIITEKDAIKVMHPPDFPLLVAVQTTKISEPEFLEDALKKLIGERRETA